MELRHLRYFVAVAEELHFGRAAERLHMAQPPLSQQIHRLEEELGVQLFLRNNKRVELTEAGRILLSHAQDILQRIEDAVMATQRAFKGEIGQLTIGFVGAATQDIVPMVQTYRQGFPFVQINLRQMTRFEQIEGIKEGRIQVGFHRPPINDANLSMEVVRREPFMVVLPEAHPLTKLKVVSVHDLADEPFVLPPQYWGSSYYDNVMNYCRAHGVLPKVLQDATEASTIVELVAAGIGISLAPASTASRYTCGVQYRPLKEEAPVAEMAAIWKKNAEKSSSILQSFLTVVRECSALGSQPV